MSRIREYDIKVYTKDGELASFVHRCTSVDLPKPYIKIDDKDYYYDFAKGVYRESDADGDDIPF